jgi:hypothetical protein
MFASRQSGPGSAHFRRAFGVQASIASQSFSAPNWNHHKQSISEKETATVDFRDCL